MKPAEIVRKETFQICRYTVEELVSRKTTLVYIFLNLLSGFKVFKLSIKISLLTLSRIMYIKLYISQYSRYLYTIFSRVKKER